MSGLRTLAIAALVTCTVAATACADEAVRPLVIQSSPIKFAAGDADTRSVGKLIHRGSLKLTSPDAAFGGISGLLVSEDGERFLAITDASHWLTGTLRYRDDTLAGAAGIEIGPLLDMKGKALEGKDGDAEGVAGSLDGDVFVSFERDHRIWRYAFAADGLTAKAKRVAAPPELARAPDNSGLEGIALLSDGRLLALTEAFKDANGNFRGWLIPPDGKSKIESLALKARPPFELTDVRELPGGDVLTLERRYSPVGGVGFAMRRIPMASIAADAVLDGEVQANAGMSFLIDNMEALAVRKTSEGKTLVYLASDDNFNTSLQQTLLMMFELKE